MWHPRRLHLATALLLLLAASLLIRPTTAQSPGETSEATSAAYYLPVIYDNFNSLRPPERMGLVFVNSAEDLRSPQRIQRGIDAGAELDRFPLYWHLAEPQPGVFDWSQVDAAIQANLAQGLNTLPIFLGTPPHYFPEPVSVDQVVPMPPVGGGPTREGLQKPGSGPMMENGCTVQGTPPSQNLFVPIFDDGTDIPGPGKSINPNNYWARFIFKAVERYRPGGPAGTAVRYWELWNEPDLCHFFGGSVDEYARMLKVGYLAIEQADPDARMMWGGLALYGPKYEGGQHFLNDLVARLKADPMAVQYSGFFDYPAIHQYSTSTHGYTYKTYIRNALTGTPWRYKPIWVTESGVPVCGSFPGPECPSPYRGTAQDQAAYIWQNIAYSRIGGNEGPIFHFQLHDDCGNIPSPVPPADAFGLITNAPSAPCPPHIAEPRPSYTAYQLAKSYLVDGRFLFSDMPLYGMRRFVVEHEMLNERRTMLWAVYGSNVTYNLQATGSSALVLRPDGSTDVVTPVNGQYTFTLPASTNQNQPGSSTYTIGGYPFLVIEDSNGGPAPAPRQ